jgi:D-3-phosphoglycerate dehydrogenase / 2-oxoglutarate reductase
MKILVVGDSFCPVGVFGAAFERLEAEHDVAAFDVVDEPGWVARTPSEQRIREYLGSPAQLIERLAGHDVLVVQGAPVTDAVLDAAPSLRLVCVARGGPVNVDVDAATERGIPVVTTPGKNAQAVAELTFGLVIMLARRMPAIARYLEGGGELARDNYEGAKWFGHDLEGRLLGVVGFGQVGRRVAALGVAFGMHVLVHDPFVPGEVIERSGVAPSGSLDDLLASADVVTLHARATRENRGLMGREQFARMKRGALFVNTSRDTLVDEEALYDALADGRLAGAGLDVVQPPDLAIPPELGRRHRLLDHPNVVLAPHIGGATYETLLHGGEMAAAEIERLAAGTPLVNVANRAALAGAAGAAR